MVAIMDGRLLGIVEALKSNPHGQRHDA